MEKLIDNIKFDEKGLVPVIAQDYMTGEVLMLAYMNRDTLLKTMETGYATYWSRSRQEVWVKGATSGNKQLIKEMTVDCDGDTILIKIEQIGQKACHTGERSCFYRRAAGDALEEINTFERRDGFALTSSLIEDYQVVAQRREEPKEGSYTNYLFDKGLDKILKKVGEESAEIIIAAKNKEYSEIRYEVADLMYHLTVLLCERDMSWEDIMQEIIVRRK